MPNVIMITYGTGGDVFSFIRIGEKLVSKGYSVTLITNSPYQEKVCRAGLQFVALDTPEEFHQFVSNKRRLSSMRDIISFYRHIELFSF